MIDGLPNWFWVTRDGDLSALTLEKGINGVAPIRDAGGGFCRPVVLIRSSPWKAGSFSTPWHDVFDLEHSHVRYFGDNRPELKRPPHETPGNKLLRQLAAEHGSTDENVRARSAPLLVLRSVTVDGRHKGQVEFCGLAVVAGHEFVHQIDPTTGEPFDNYAFELALLDLVPEANTLDLRWIQARRSPHVDALRALELAPAAWRDWVQTGSVSMPRLDGDVAVAIAELKEVVSPRGQGFHVGTQVRGVIQQQALALARAHFESLGWTVDDGLRYGSRAFYVSKVGQGRHVVVKGTQSAGRQILLTADEVDQVRAHYPATILAVVSGIQLVDHDGTGNPRAVGGSVHLADPLNVDDGALKPVTYMYDVSGS